MADEALIATLMLHIEMSDEGVIHVALADGDHHFRVMLTRDDPREPKGK